jgi:hypothetical protein
VSLFSLDGFFGVSWFFRAEFSFLWVGFGRGGDRFLICCDQIVLVLVCFDRRGDR